MFFFIVMLNISFTIVLTNKLKTNKMKLEIYTELKNEIQERLDVVSTNVQAFSNNGAAVLMTPEFKSAKNAFEIVFKQLQVLNKHTPNSVKREYSKLRRKNRN